MKKRKEKIAMNEKRKTQPSHKVKSAGGIPEMAPEFLTLVQKRDLDFFKPSCK
jgi:hypothetical protein